MLRASGNRLGIVTTLAPTEYGIRTLMHDPMYRNGVANKNTGYDQVGFASFYLGDEAELPEQQDRHLGALHRQHEPDHHGDAVVEGRGRGLHKVSFKATDTGKIARSC